MKRIIVLTALFPVISQAQVIPDTTTRPAPVHSSKVNPVPAAYANGTKVNYVRTWEAGKPFTSESTITDTSRTVAEVKQTTVYIDGLGRPIQTVAKQVSPTGKDLVSPVVYDAFGREIFKYLPYVQVTGNTNDGNFKTDPFNAQASFYANGTYNPGVVGEQVYYSRTSFENSPLMRPDSSFAPGNSWGGSHIGVAMKYTVNKAADSVRIWMIVMTAGATPTSSTVYGTGELHKTVTTDENGKQVVEYKDKQGQVVLKKVQLASSPSVHHTGWLCTYYVYDDFGNLRFVIPPKAVEALAGPGLWSIGSTVKDELCFRYEYDGAKRMIIKKVPGAGEVSMVYDARDRLVMTQDANLNASGKWMVTKYDELNRPVQTYLWVNGNNRSYHEAEADSSTAYPTLSGTYDLLTESYFDDYSWVSSSGSGLSSTLISTYNSNTDYFYTASSSSPYPQALTATYQTTGMPTGSKIRVIGTSTFLHSVNFYDDRGRVIQSHTTNYSGGKDTATMQYDFTGKVLRALLCHVKPSGNSQRHIVLTKNEYDDAGRLVTVKKKANNSPEATIVANSYDEIGQLKQKALGKKRDETNQNTYTSSVIETLNYSYNIRGWLRGINKDYARGSGTNWFGMELSYDVGFSQDQLNGNIAGIRWQSNGSDVQRSYGFTYDAVNRILKSDFTQKNESNWNTTAGIDYSMKMGDGSDASTAYDANGNILSMWQKGLKINTSATIDSLTYTYQTSSNKLAEVTDGITPDNKLGDFKDVNTAQDDYMYDVNGNMEYDRNKAISKIIYNHLNLPDSIRILGKGTIKYYYDAVGNKLQKKTVDSTVSATKTTITSYLGTAVYINDTLQFIGHEEGRLRENRVNGKDTFYYDYFVKDHLGNIRMVLTDELKSDIYQASMETSTASAEEALFANISTTRVNKPDGFDSDTGNTKVAGLKGNTSGTVIGPSKVLKVMAGDKVNVNVWGYDPSTFYGLGEHETLPVINDLISALFSQGVMSNGGKFGLSYTDLQTYLSPGVTEFLDEQPNSQVATYGRAYLSWILLSEEQFILVRDGSGFVQLPSGMTDKDVLQANDGDGIEISQNGYLYIYVSNSNPDVEVYFDDLHIEHIRGPLLEETHYYPFGLTMAGISSNAATFGNPENKAKYNGIEYERSFDLNIGETFFRTHDSQIGRWWQIDPKPTERISLYAAMNNNPILLADPMGDTTWVYNQKGVLLGMIPDGLKNQVHYMKGEEGENGQIKTDGLTKKQLNELGKSYRSQSMAFIGSKTVSDMKKIIEKSVKAKKEMAFVGSVGSDKEIRLKALPVHKDATMSSNPTSESIDAQYSKAQQAGLFLYGHTHVRAYLTGLLPGDKQNPQAVFGAPTYPGDYVDALYRSANATQRGPTPALIVTPWGVTTYGTDQKKNYGNDNNAYLQYVSLK